MKTETKDLHYRYWLGILLLALVLVVTQQWGDVEGLMERITFALTLTSMALAALAIVYAFVSNSSIGQNLSRLDAASSSLERGAESVERAATEMGARFGHLPDMIHEVGVGVRKTNELLAGKRTEAPSPDDSPKTFSSDDPDNLDFFVEGASFVGLTALFAFSLAHQQKRAYNPFEFERILPFHAAEAHHQFLVATSCAQLIDFEYEEPEVSLLTRMTHLFSLA